MNDAPRYATVQDYLKVVRGQRLLIVLTVLVFGGLALVLSASQTPQYRTSASLSTADESQDTAILGTAIAPSTTPEGRAAATAALATRPEVVDRVRSSLRLRATREQVINRVAARAEARTNLVVVEATSSDADFAARLANAFATAMRDQSAADSRKKYADAADVTRASLRRVNRIARRSRADRLEQVYNQQSLRDRLSRLESLAQFVEPVQIARTATVDDRPISPTPVRDTFLGLIVGLVLALVAAFLRDALDRRFRDSASIRDELRLPMIGHVRSELLGRTMVSANGRPPLDDEDLESFRIIRSNLEYLDVDHPPKALLVTSGLPEEGKTTVSSAIATAFAVAGRKVLLVECDLRRPTLAKRLGVQPGPGLTNYLSGRATPQEVVQVIDVPGGEGRATFAVITAGEQVPRPAELLASKRLRDFLEQVTGVYDHVVLDSAPLLSVGDTRELIPRADAVVMCVRVSSTTRDQARAARAALAHFPDRPTGLVVTGIKPGDDVDYDYYSYAYAYGPTAASSR